MNDEFKEGGRLLAWAIWTSILVRPESDFSVAWSRNHDEINRAMRRIGMRFQGQYLREFGSDSDWDRDAFWSNTPARVKYWNSFLGATNVEIVRILHRDTKKSITQHLSCRAINTATAGLHAIARALRRRRPRNE
jgi:hypothetical protein